MRELTKYSITELSRLISRREVSAAEVTEGYLENIREKDGNIGAYITVTEDAARKKAAQVDKKIAAGEKLPPLAGIPGGIKDNMCTKGVRTTCASKMLENFVPCYTSTAVEHLEKMDYVMLGKVNMDEFAMGSSTENSAFKITRNPAAPDCVPGGSSGGSAAAVAAEEAAFTLGSDTGGSIRQPAAFCGVVGMKPTYGAVSRYGLVAFASSLDQIGPLTKNVADNALVLNAISAHDGLDATSISGERPDYTEDIGKDISGMRVGLPSEFFGEGISSDVKAAVMAAAKAYESLGCEIVELHLPSLDYALSAYYVISSAEASSNLARFDGIRYGYRSEKGVTLDEVYRYSRTEGFGPEVQRRIMLGTFALSSGYYDAYYKKALQVRTLIMEEYKKSFETCQFILSPVAPTAAYKIGEKTENPIEMYMGDIYSVPVNIAGLPALSLPCGKTEDGRPIGMQLIGKPLSEGLLYRAGYAYEREFGGR